MTHDRGRSVTNVRTFFGGRYTMDKSTWNIKLITTGLISILMFDYTHDILFPKSQYFSTICTWV